MVPRLLIIVEICDQLPVIIQAAFSIRGIGRAMVADDVQNEFHSPAMQFRDQS
jgi:hypothetical protein